MDEIKLKLLHGLYEFCIRELRKASSSDVETSLVARLHVLCRDFEDGVQNCAEVFRALNKEKKILDSKLNTQVTAESLSKRVGYVAQHIEKLEKDNQALLKTLTSSTAHLSNDIQLMSNKIDDNETMSVIFAGVEEISSAVDSIRRRVGRADMTSSIASQIHELGEAQETSHLAASKGEAGINGLEQLLNNSDNSEPIRLLVSRTEQLGSNVERINELLENPGCPREIADFGKIIREMEQSIQNTSTSKEVADLSTSVAVLE